jgi:hypothetical protein
MLAARGPVLQEKHFQLGNSGIRKGREDSRGEFKLARAGEKTDRGLRAFETRATRDLDLLRGETD